MKLTRIYVCVCVWLEIKNKMERMDQEELISYVEFKYILTNFND